MIAANQHYAFVNLPSEMKRLTASYLCPRDALNLSETCESVHTGLSLRLLRNPVELFTDKTFHGSYSDGDRQIPFVHIPPIPCSIRRVHSIMVSFRWHDQGWGNQKGQVYIVARHRDAPSDMNLPFHGGRVVCASPLAPREIEDCTLFFASSSMEGEIYQLWYRVGGGGGHTLTVLHGYAHTFIFDDEQGNVSRNYDNLNNAGALVAVNPESWQSARSTFYPQLLLLVSRLLHAQLMVSKKANEGNGSNKDSTVTQQSIVDMRQDDSLAEFFRVSMIPLTEGSLSAIDEILQSSLDNSHGSLERN